MLNLAPHWPPIWPSNPFLVTKWPAGRHPLCHIEPHAQVCLTSLHYAIHYHQPTWSHQSSIQPSQDEINQQESPRRHGHKKAAESLKTALRQNSSKTESPIKVNLQSQPKTPPTFKPELKPIQPPPTFRSKSPRSNSFFPSLFYN